MEGLEQWVSKLQHCCIKGGMGHCDACELQSLESIIIFGVNFLTIFEGSMNPYCS